MPAAMWSLTWQWNSQVPAASARMSATFMLPGSSSSMSPRSPIMVAVLPCQCGVCRSTSVPRENVYHRTRSPLADAHHRPVAVDEPVDGMHQVAFFKRGRVLRGDLVRRLGQLGEIPLQVRTDVFVDDRE